MRTNHFLCFLGTFLLIVSCQKTENDGSISNNKERVSVTGEAEDITSVGAKISAWANVLDEFKPLISFGIEYSTYSSMSNPSRQSASSLDSDGKYYISLSRLEHTKTYYYRSYLKYISTSYYEYGDIRSFTTSAAKPTFDNDKSSSMVDGNSVTCFFPIDDDGGAQMNSFFIYYSTQDFNCLNLEEKVSSGRLKSISAEYVSGDVRATITGLDEVTEYYACAVVKSSAGDSHSTVISFKTDLTAPSSGNSIDLGLSVYWSNRNLGATTPTDYCDYYRWGETSPLTGADYKFYVSNNNFSKYNKSDGKTVLDLTDDAARSYIGGKWRIPTKEEAMELSENCTALYGSYDGCYGVKLTSTVKGYEGNSIFIPSMGYKVYVNRSWVKVEDSRILWTASLYTDDSIYDYGSCAYVFFPGSSDRISKLYRDEYALPIRPVKDK